MTAERKPRITFVLSACLAIAILGYAVPLAHWGSTAGKDWDLFSGYSLIIRTYLLHYHRLPLHDPWVWGGLDLLSNPQLRTFSPLVLLDLLFKPYSSDLLALILYGFAGMAGMTYVLLDRGLSPLTALAGATIFAQSSWFGLHFVEGHIAFGSMQLFPWVYYFARRLDKPGGFFGLVSLMALFVLDGGIYAAIFSVLLLATAAGVGLIHPLSLLKAGRRTLAFDALALVAGLLLISIKVIPVLSLSTHIRIVRDFTSLTASDLLRILFNPFQRHLDIASTVSLWRFHEFGCYLSLVGLGLVVWQLRAARFARETAPLLISFGLFFWLGSGWGGIFNPWNLYQRIPLFNIAHVQSRLFVLMEFFFAMLVAEAIERMRDKRALCMVLAAFLIGEALFVKNYPFHYGYLFAKPHPDLSIIPDASIQGEKMNGDKPDIYLHGNYSYLHAYETSASETTQVRHEGDPAYRGMLYVLGGNGTAKLESYTPGRIEITYAASTPLRAEVNSNYLAGWAVESGSARAHPDPNGLIGVDFEPGNGRAVLRYAPFYLRPLLISYALGVLLWLGLAFHLARTVKRAQ